ncbi:RcpC/CpaB family pilus assembly protein [Pseudooceanicola aestuarii]|uniref:RcpC/CpaB family pilus assembly protein n=1 Tax=Pseudooceanicola aestuarii TaxID=2697319 RepID=UPI0013D0C2FD|nr:RcpC/CpaB family pilus assembly protein [Pseudooceanicola aestuarii]
MRRNVITFLATGLVLTALSGAGTYALLSNMNGRLQQAQTRLDAYGQAPDVPVLVADVAPGAPLTPDLFRMETIAAEYLPASVIRNLDLLDGTAPRATRALTAGAFLLASDLSIAADRNWGEVMVPFGQSALALAPHNLADFAPSLTPGDRIDVFWRGPQEAAETRVIATAIRVAGLSRPERSGEAPDPVDGAGSATAQPVALVVTAPSETMARLVAAQQEGDIFIAPSNQPLDLNAPTIQATRTQIDAMPHLQAPRQWQRVTTRTAPAEAPLGLPSPPSLRRADVAAPDLAPDLRSDSPDAPQLEGREGTDTLREFLQALPARPISGTCQLTVVRSDRKSTVEVPC